MPAVRLDQVAPGAELGKAGGRVWLNGEEGREPVLGRVGEGWVWIEGGIGLHLLLFCFLLALAFALAFAFAFAFAFASTIVIRLRGLSLLQVFG